VNFAGEGIPEIRRYEVSDLLTSYTHKPIVSQIAKNWNSV
jgi:hypothetical protein